MHGSGAQKADPDLSMEWPDKKGAPQMHFFYGLLIVFTMPVCSENGMKTWRFCFWFIWCRHIIYCVSIIPLRDCNGMSVYATKGRILFWFHTGIVSTGGLCNCNGRRKECNIDPTTWKESQSDNYWSDQNSESTSLAINDKIFGPIKVGVVGPAPPALRA